MAKFWITTSRFIKLKGQQEPVFIAASPGQPVLVDLPDDVKPSRDMASAETPPEKPLPAHAIQPGGQVKSASIAGGAKRIADR